MGGPGRLWRVATGEFALPTRSICTPRRSQLGGAPEMPVWLVLRCFHPPPLARWPSLGQRAQGGGCELPWRTRITRQLRGRPRPFVSCRWAEFTTTSVSSNSGHPGRHTCERASTPPDKGFSSGPRGNGGIFRKFLFFKNMMRLASSHWPKQLHALAFLLESSAFTPPWLGKLVNGGELKPARMPALTRPQHSAEFGRLPADYLFRRWRGLATGTEPGFD